VDTALQPVIRKFAASLGGAAARLRHAVRLGPLFLPPWWFFMIGWFFWPWVSV